MFGPDLRAFFIVCIDRLGNGRLYIVEGCMACIIKLVVSLSGERRGQCSLT